MIIVWHTISMEYGILIVCTQRVRKSKSFFETSGVIRFSLPKYYGYLFHVSMKERITFIGLTVKTVQGRRYLKIESYEMHDLSRWIQIRSVV